jgi:hypothetical protein
VDNVIPVSDTGQTAHPPLQYFGQEYENGLGLQGFSRKGLAFPKLDPEICEAQSLTP